MAEQFHPRAYREAITSLAIQSENSSRAKSLAVSRVFRSFKSISLIYMYEKIDAYERVNVNFLTRYVI